MMRTYKYSPLSKFYFRYANLALTFILLTYFVVLTLGVKNQPYLIIPAALNLFITFALNKYYINTYRMLPFVIKTDDEKLSASDFMFGKKIIEIKYSDIDEISGGVFGFNPKGLVYIHDGEQKISISIHPNIENANSLLQKILSKMKEDLRDEALRKLKQRESIKKTPIR